MDDKLEAEAVNVLPQHNEAVYALVHDALAGDVPLKLLRAQAVYACLLHREVRSELHNWVLR